MRRTRTVAIAKGRNSLWLWTRVKNPFRVAFNYIIISFCRILPSLKLKNFLYKLIGVKVGKDVAFALESTVDVFFPELIEVGDNSIIGYDSTILTHEFLRDEVRVGEVKIGKNVVIGARTLILPGVTIGDNSVISAFSLVNRDVPPNVLAGGVPCRVIKKLGEGDGEKSGNEG